MPIIPLLGKLMEDCFGFETSQDYKAGSLRREEGQAKGKGDAQRTFVYDGTEHYLHSPYCNAKTLSELSEFLKLWELLVICFLVFQYILEEGYLN